MTQMLISSEDHNSLVLNRLLENRTVYDLTRTGNQRVACSGGAVR